MLAFNMMVPPKVRANMGSRTLSMDDTLKALKLPVLVTQRGRQTRLPPPAKHGRYHSGCQALALCGIGHAPFWEGTASRRTGGLRARGRQDH
jgi:hypothetical protein